MILILIALLAFMVGFWCGLIKMAPKKPSEKVRLEQQEDLQNIENFLSYDGTEQI